MIKGRLTAWDDAKGYGFVDPFDGSNRIFVHIKAFENRARRPAVGDVITFSLSTDARGRPCAAKARIAGVSKTVKRGQSRVLPELLAAGFLVLVVGAVQASAVPLLMLPLYVLASAATFGAYAIDKSAAKRGAARLPEKTLHILALIGGWPGALIAQNRLRHKSRKQPFRAVFWVTVLANSAAFLWLFTPEGSRTWQAITNSMP